MIFLKDIMDEFEKYIVLKDGESTLRVVFGNIVSNIFIPGNPVWTTLIAPSSGGKTTLLAPLEASPLCFFINDLTEKTFISGYKVGGKEYSVLKLANNRVIVIPDLTTILSKNAQSKSEILGQARQIYDGDFIKYTGTGKIAWKGKIGMLMGCTPSIYKELEGARAMGERFLYFQMLVPSDDEVANKIATVKISALELTEKMKPLVLDYLEDMYNWVKKHNYEPNINLSDEQNAEIKFAAKFCVEAKATVSTDYKSGKVDGMPNKAGLGRDYNMFLQIIRGWVLMKAYELQDPNYHEVSDDMMTLVKRHAYASLSRERRKVLEIMSATTDKLSASEIGARDGFGLEKESVEKYLAPLHAIGIIQKVPGKSGQANRWYISNEERKEWVTDISVFTKETGFLSEEQLKLLEESGKEEGRTPVPEWRSPEIDQVENIWGGVEPSFD